MKRLAVVALLVAGCAPAAAETRIGKMASDPYIKVSVAEPKVEHRHVVVEPEPAPVETTVAPRDLLAECRTVVAELLPTHPPAPGWSVLCRAPNADDIETWRHRAGGHLPQGYADPTAKTIHLMPSHDAVDLGWLYRHETGHSHCIDAGDYTESCADALAAEWAA